MNYEDEYSFENLLSSAPASVALLGQTVLMTMMGTDASLLFSSYDGRVITDGEGALKIFQWATTIRSDVVHLVLCGAKAIEVGEKYMDEVVKNRNNQELYSYSNVITELHQLVKTALCNSMNHSNEILVQINSFLDRYPRKPSNPSNTSPCGSVFTTIELMRQAVVRSQKAYDQLHQCWIKYGRLCNYLLETNTPLNFLTTYLRISHDFMNPATNSVRELLKSIFDSDSARNENAAVAVEKARNEMMTFYNNACDAIKTLQI